MRDQTSKEEIRYPIGKVKLPEVITEQDIKTWISVLEETPEKLKYLVRNLNEKQLDTPYRDGGWTIRQVLHHLVDSHMNSYIRFKWTLTEKEPLIKAYFEDRWADLPDTKDGPVDLALQALEALHAKWTYLLRGLNPDQLKRCFIHPESNSKVSLEQNIGIYAWHSKHHTAHIEHLMKRQGWI
jgi:hypothetical protein